jgi:hypothetical protein
MHVSTKKNNVVDIPAPPVFSANTCKEITIIIIIIIIKNFVCSPKGFSAYNYNMQFKIKLYYIFKI